MKSVYQRVYELIDILGVNKNDFADTLRVSIQMLNSMRRKQIGGPSADTIANLFNAYPRVNERWVLLNEGKPVKEISLPMFQESEILYSTEVQELLRLVKKDKDSFNIIEMVLKLEAQEQSIRTLTRKVEKLEKSLNKLLNNQNSES